MAKVVEDYKVIEKQNFHFLNKVLTFVFKFHNLDIERLLPKTLTFKLYYYGWNKSFKKA